MRYKINCNDSRCRPSDARGKVLPGPDPLSKEEKEKKALIPSSIYLQEDVLYLGRRLLGCFLFSKKNGIITAGKIVETESYAGINDRASHAYGDKRTARTDAMYLSGGIAYVYLCYGMHHLFNVVTAPKGTPHAVLIRAVEPIVGIKEMLKRRKLTKLGRNLTAGPAMLTEALAISKEDNKRALDSSTVWIEDRKKEIISEDIIASARVGVAYAKEDALLPYRFRIRENPWTSLAN